ncbi:MAG TPA: S8 family serine peptidase, partial [Thermoanaerobaculia bacterium]|nr:S8 family serine peptidase [Thermoanaerobaculia bacterium]
MDRSLLALALRALGSALLLVTLAVVPLAAEEPPGKATLRMAGGLFLVPADARLPAAAAGTIVHRYPEANLVRIGTTAALTPALQSRLSAVAESDRAAYRSWTGSYPPLARTELAALPRGYYLARLVGPVDAAWLAQLASAGLDVLDHEAPYTVLLRGGGEGFEKAAGIRTSEGFPVVESLLPLPVEARLSETLLALATGVLAADDLPGLLRTADGAVIVRAFPHPGTDAEAVLAAVARYLPRVEPELAWGAEDAFAASGPELLPLLAAIADLAYLEPVYERELHNNLAAKDYILNIEPVWRELGYNGDGVIVGHNDGGVSLSHPDFPAGVIVATQGAMTNTNNEHGTHTAGSVVGRGLAGSSPTNNSGCGDRTPPLPTVRGMAWGARLVTNNIFNGGATDETAMMQWSYSQGARLNTNSWGYRDTYTYNAAAATVDGLVRDAATAAGNQELMILFSAGNDGAGASTVKPPGTAKNVLTVGATQNDRCGSYVPSQQDGPSIDTIT